MSKILLIEPSRMLQHAFVLALFPEHDIEIAADMRATLTHSSGVDLAIIDAATLRQRNPAPVDVPGTSANRPFPILWIDTTASTATSSSRTTQLALPFSKEELRAAVGKLLQTAAVGNEKEASRGNAPAAAPRHGRSPKSVASKGESDKKIIELVEVVEEADDPNDPSVNAHSRN
jgi:hypothetical protein